MPPLPTGDDLDALPPDGGSEFNRLVFEPSPYLRQHARNPVDWWPWSGEALARARELDRPIFLSVGYATCHWCHVMEHESFESEDIAALLGEEFVPIKVDREERPDLDDLYMKATQLTTGRGGWPNSLWLTPDGRPWFAGTYFPPDDRPGQTGFRTLLLRLAELWRDRRGEVEAQAKQIATRIEEWTQEMQKPGRATPDSVDRLIDELRQNFDDHQGGFGGAPKFPPHGALALLADEVEAGTSVAAERCAPLLEQTLLGIARGGIHDHIGGGFHRYATDDQWLLPHFEKMLYDNALLVPVYARASRCASSPERRQEFGRAARRAIAWMQRDLEQDGAGFASALDADSLDDAGESEEGFFYTWTVDDIARALEIEDAEFAKSAWRFQREGNFLDESTRVRTGRNVPHLDVEAKTIDFARLDRLAEPLRSLREERQHPQLDDKLIVAWNGLAIAALAISGEIFGEAEYLASARRAADRVLAERDRLGFLPRIVRGATRSPAGDPRGFLEDYAFFADGLLDLAGALGDEGDRYARAARELAGELVDGFHDGATGGFHTTTENHERLIVRAQEAFDAATPSGYGIAVRVLDRIAAEDDDASLERVALRALNAAAGSIERHVRGCESLVRVLAARRRRHDGRNHEPDAVGAPRNDVGDGSSVGDSVRITLFLDRLMAREGETCRAIVRVDAAPGSTCGAWNESGAEGEPPSEPTRGTIEVEGAEPLELEALAPASESPNVQWGAATFELPATSDGLGFRVEAAVRVQVCTDDRCLAPETLRVRVILGSVEGRPDESSAPASRYPDLFARLNSG